MRRTEVYFRKRRSVEEEAIGLRGQIARGGNHDKASKIEGLY